MSDKEARKAMDTLNEIKERADQSGDGRDLNKAVQEYHATFREHREAIIKHAGLDKLKGA